MDGSPFLELSITVRQGCALAALTVRKLGLAGKNPIDEVDLEWIFACNCEGTEQLRIKKEVWCCPDLSKTDYIGVSIHVYRDRETHEDTTQPFVCTTKESVWLQQQHIHSIQQHIADRTV